MERTSNILILSLVILLFGSCAIRPGARKGGKSLFETFYFGEQGTQYFIYPLEFEEVDGDDVLSMDFTFRYKNALTDTADIKLSLLSTEVIKEIDRLEFSTAVDRAEAISYDLMYNERDNRLFESRFIIEIPLADLRPLFRNEPWTVELEIGGKTRTYKSTSRTNKKIATLEAGLFVITN